MASKGVGKSFFIVNLTDQSWTGLHDRTGYEAPPYKAVRPQGQPDEEASQFDEGEARLFVSNLSPYFKDGFKIDRVQTEAEDNEKVVLGPPQIRQSVPNGDGLDYPEGIPEMNWDVSQCRAWLRDNDEGILGSLRLTSAVETIVLKVWTKHDPERAKVYEARTAI